MFHLFLECWKNIIFSIMLDFYINHFCLCQKYLLSPSRIWVIFRAQIFFLFAPMLYRKYLLMHQSWYLSSVGFWHRLFSKKLKMACYFFSALYLYLIKIYLLLFSYASYKFYIKNWNFFMVYSRKKFSNYYYH